RAHRQRGRVELPVRRRHHAGNDMLPPERAPQDPGAPRLAGFLDDRNVELHGGLFAGSLGLAAAQLVFRAADAGRCGGGDMASLTAGGAWPRARELSLPLANRKHMWTWR